MTLRSYVSVLKYEDHVWGHKYYCKAAAGAINAYLALDLKPMLSVEEEEEKLYAGMTSAQKKSAKANLRKKKKKDEEKRLAAIEANRLAEEEAEKKKKEDEDDEEEPAEDDFGKDKNAEKDKKKKKGGEKPKDEPVDPDPEGRELAMKNSLDEAKKLAEMLVLHAPKELDSWLLSFDVALRRKEFALAATAIEKAMVINAESEEVFSRIVQLAVNEDGKAEAAKFLNNGTASAFVSSKTAALGAAASLKWRLVLTTAAILSGSAAPAACDLTIAGINVRGSHSVKTCEKAYNAIKGFSGCENKAADWKSLCNKKFSKAIAFL